ncbi:hypothetical protein C4J96_4550 [Pseudomonas orientalis]|uniref:hypothetical protein n=1 Tax=Pseudomonas orientalis TaxID=76758 RepID=UPI000F583566|nr:hypothetical protein [Pseudomonas orientalis]AZE96628.1 hypothetical protein C4J96_4550 [Pseudomonas orientalis]
MGRIAKFSLVSIVVVVIAIAGSIVFVPPKKALSAAIMRNCISVVKDKVGGAGPIEFVSVAAIQPDPNTKKIEDFGSATQALIKRGEIEPSEPEVLVEFETDRGASNALCTYQADLSTSSGTYSMVTMREVQIGVQALPAVEVLLIRSFRVGYVDRTLSLLPIIGTKQKFFLD